MKKAVACVLLILTLFVSFSFVTNVNAKDSLMLNVNKNEVKLGEEIIVSIDVDSEHTDLYAYTAKLSYDKDVFEVIETEDFEEQENWSNITYNKENNRFALINKKGVNSEKLLQLKLKVKEDAKAGKTAITVNSITASDGKKDIKIDGSSVEVLVQKDGLNNGESIPSNKVEIPAEDDTSIEVKKSVPVVGIILIILMLAIVVSLIYYYLKLAKEDSNNKKIVISAIALVILVILLVLTIKIFNTKNPDVDKDGDVDYDDSQDIIEYILDIEKPQDDEEAQDKDLNNDGKITITDVAQATDKATNQGYTGNITNPSQDDDNDQEQQPSEPTEPDEPIEPEEPDYNSSIGNSSVSNLTPKKGEDVTLDLNIDITPYTDVEGVIIDGEIYPVEKGEGNNYKVTIPAPENAGLREVVITGVVLDNGKEVETEYKVTLDVLKDIPQLGDFAIDTEKEIPEVSVNIKDADGAIKSGKVIVTDEEGNVVFESNKLADGQNTYALDNLEKDKKYNVKVEVEYDLDSDVYGNPEDNKGNDTLVNQDFVINADYGFEGTEYSITERVTDKDPLVLSFKNSYDSYYDVESVVIDGQKYQVSKVGDIYQVVLGKGTKGRNTINIEEVVLKNGESYNVDKELEYVYLKNEPTIGNVEAELNDSKVKVKVNNQDTDGTIKSVTAYLTDSEGNIIDSKVLEDGQSEVEFDVNKSGDYKVKVEVTYDLGDEEEVTKTVEYTEEIKEPVKVTIVNNKIDNNYVQKGQRVEVTYTVETNTDDTIASFVINGITLNAVKNDDGTYTVSFNAPQDDGIAQLDVTKVVFTNEGEAEAFDALEYEVLKSEKPVVDALSVVDKEEDGKATLAFTITDVEETFVKGRIVITHIDAEGNEKEVVNKEFTSIGDTIHELDNIKDFENYKVEVYITYDLDIDKIDTDNQYEEKFAQTDFELIGNYEFNFSELKVDDVNRDRNVVVLKFKTTLAEAASDTYYIQSVVINGVTYPVTLGENRTYTVEVPYTNTDRQELVVQEAILNNLQGFAITENNSVVVFKTAPTAIVRSTVTRELVDGLRTITASLQVIDEESTIVSGTLHARLLDPEGNQIDTVDLDVTSEEVVFNSDTIYDAGTYTIEVRADYNTVDGIKHNAEKLGDAKVGVAIYANIDKAEISKHYAQKGEELEITYIISTNSEETISGITVNGEILPATKNADGTYTVVVSAPDKYGKYTFDTTRIVYANEQTSATNTIDIDVLRDVKPSISNVVVDDKDIEKPVLTFTITDDEDTFVSGKIIITNTETNDKQELNITSKNDTSFVLEGIEEFKEYNVEIELTYDFDSDKFDATHQTTEKLAESKFVIIGEYNFSLQDFRLVEVDADRKVIVVAFDSQNESGYDVQKVFINGNEYTVKSKDENSYTVEIPYENDTRTELNLEKVILENLKDFTDLEQNSIVVFKNRATATIETTVSNTMNSIKATFDIKDQDDVLSALCVRLVDAQGNVIETKNIEEHTKEVEFISKYEAFTAGEYTVEILVDYDRVDGKLHEQETIASANAKVEILASVVSVETEKLYVDKESVITLTYEIKSNTDKELKSVTINGVVYTPTMTEDGKYSVVVNTPEVAGEFEYKLTELVYSEDETINATSDIKVDVLKNTDPKVSGLAVDTTLEKPLLSFMVSDDENTFVKGRIVITNTEDNTYSEITFDSLEKLSFELENIEEFTKYDVDVFITYDFDSDKENIDNQYEKLLAEKQFEAIGDYEFTFSNFRVKEVDTQNEVVVLEFESTNASEDNDQYDYYVDTVIINGTSYENVEKNGTTYTVKVPYTQMTRTELVLERAILNNLQEFTIDNDNSVVVFKSLSAILVATVGEDLKSIKADVTLIDEDKIAEGTYVRLLDLNNQEIGKEPIDSEKAVITFSNENYYKAGTYTLEVVANYDAVDGQIHSNETIAKTTARVAAGAVIDSSESEQYAQKGKELEITYTLRTNTNEEVDTIVVNQVAYEAQKVSDGVYKVNVVVPEEAGETDLTVTRINFVDDSSANVNYTSKVEVLKSKIPTVSNLTVGGNIENPVLSFTITDEENTFVSGKYVIIDKDTNERKEYQFTAKDNTSFLLENIIEFNKYDVEVYITYDLDSDMSVGSANQNEELAQKGQFEIIGEYDFTLDNFKIVEVNRESNTVKLSFESTNASEDYYVRQVEINGVTYENLERDGNTYTLEISYDNEERTELKLTKAVLDNLKEFTDLQNSVVIFKDKPSVQLNAYTNEKQETITADITLTDNDNTLAHLNVKLINPKGDVIETRDIDNDEFSVNFKSPENGIFKAGEYRIEVGADYNLDDGLVHEDKDKIGEATVKISTVASIQETKVENYYVQKEENVSVVYTFKSNNDSDPTGIMIENTLYTTTRNDDGTYTVSVPADSSVYGLKKYTVSVVMYNGETVVLSSPVETEYYVLKDKPSLEDFTFNKLVKDQTITFNFVDNDNTLSENASLVVVDEEGNEVLTHKLEVGQNTVELKDLNNGKYTVKLKGTYDLDDNSEYEGNIHNLEEIFDAKEIDVISDYKLQLTIEDVAIDIDNNEIILTFESTNEAGYEVKSILIDDTEYEVELKDEKYVVRISYEDTTNRTYSITSVKLDNDIEIALDTAQSFEVFKDAPKANVSANVSDDLKTISATFTLEDNKNTVTALSARLLDKDGELVEEKSLNKEATSVEFTSEKEYKAGEYIVVIGADYELVDGLVHNTKEQIGTAKVTVGIKAEVKSVEVPEYVNKDQVFTIKLEITSNTDEEIESVKVNDNIYSVTKLAEENKYEISYTAPHKNDTLTLNVQNIIYTTSREIDATNQATTYVLKDIPSITEYKFDGTYGNAKVTFMFTDADNATLEGANIVITDKVTGEKVIEQPLSKGINTIELNELTNNKHELKIVGMYDLDSNHDNSQNQYDMTEIFNPTEIEFISDYNLTFSISKVEVIKDLAKTKVTFDSTNAGNYNVASVKVDGKDYPVTYEDGIGYALIDYTGEEKQEFTITDVTLANGVELAIETEAKYVIFKNKPAVNDLTAVVEDGTITVTFQVTDEDNIMKNAKVQLIAPNGEVKQSQAFSDKNPTIEFTDVEDAGTYTIKVVADYDRIDGENHIEEVLEETTTKIKIVANVLSDTTSIYAEKEEEIEIIYEIESNTVEKVSNIEINGVKYPAEEIEEGKYQVKYTTSTTAGEEKLEVTSLDYEFGENVEVSYNSTVEVLKDKLSVENFNVDNSTSKIIVTYDMIDDDMSFVSGKIKATNTANNNVTEVEISKSTSEYTLELENLQIYNIELEITYDRDNDNSNDEHESTEVFGTQENVQFVSEYNLEVDNFMLDSVESQVLFNANIKFTATNASMYPIYGVIIDGDEYQVQPVDGEKDTYLIEYPYGQENVDVRKKITVTDIVLSNNATIKLDEEQSVVIFKNKPQAQVLELDNVDNTSVRIHFELADNDETVTALYAVLQNESNEIVSEQKLDPEQYEAVFSISKSGIYTVVIKADYERADGLTHSEEIIGTSDKTVEIKPAARIETIDITEKYPNKKETIDLTYKIESNTTQVPTKVVLNDKEEYTLTQVDESANEYKISYTVSDTSQIQGLKVTKIYFGDNLSVETPNANEDIIEILKDKPIIGITSVDMLEQKAVSFTITITDPDEAMTSGKATVHGIEKDLSVGQNSFIVTDIELDESHILNVVVNYDLDYNKIDDDQNEGTITKDQEFKLVSDYGFTINELKAFSKEENKEEKYFGKNKLIELRFNSENKTSLEPEKVTIQDLKDKDEKVIEYTVNKAEDGNEYKYYVDIVTNANAGEQEFKITSVTLSGSRVIASDKFEGENPTASIEVLKDKPTISNFTANNQENSVTVEFDIKDDDNALRDSYILLINDDGTVQKKEKINVEKNTYTFNDLTPGKKYTIKVENNYVLSKNGELINEIFKEQDIEITKKEESNFRVRNLTITKRVPIGSKVGITFENSLMSYEDVDTIVIDGQEYEVKKGDNGIYKLTLDPVEKGVNRIHVDYVKIKDKEFEIDRNLSYTYEYAEPKAINVTEIKEDPSTNQAIINYQLEDEDNSVIGLTAYMKNSAGSIIASKAIELDTETTKTVSMDLRKVSTYSIELRATCDIGDNATYEEKSLFEQKKETNPRVTIVSQSIDKEYVEKEENVVLTFKINTNVDQEVKKISIGDESYKVTNVIEDGKVVEDTYSITVQAPNATGVFSQKIDSIQIGSSLVSQIIYPNDMEPINIKVFKQKPTVTHFIIDENNKKVSFRVNDPDNSLVTPYPSLIVKGSDDAVISTEELTKGGTEYEFNLNQIGMTAVQSEYNVLVDVTYDLRPDVQAEKQNIMQKILSLFAVEDETQEEGEGEEEEEDPNAKYIINENIFNENYKLAGDITYNLDFWTTGGLYTLWDYQPFYFDSPTGTDFKVTKVIIDGLEYPVEPYGKEDHYIGYYKAFSIDQDTMTFQKVILENGTALDIPAEDGCVMCYVIQSTPTLVIKDFIEDVNEETVTVKFKLVDNDKKLAYNQLTFTLMNSQGGLIDSQTIEADKTDTVVFKVPYPPTAVYKLQVTGKLFEFPDWYDYLTTWTPINDSFNSSINTSILGSELETKYPKKGETFAIDYSISSTKVIIIDKEDHTNQDKAVGITSVVVNGKDYDVQALEDKPETYRIYYTAKDEVGLEDINVTYIKFSNGDVEAFNHNDQIEVLKDVPYVTDFRSENDLAGGKIKLSFIVNDPDGVISTNNIKAVIGNDEKQITVGGNEVEFEVTPDELVDFEIKATYDLDENKLQNEENANSNTYTDNTIFERKLMLTGDYNITFENLKMYNTINDETHYFEKNENITLTFDCTTRNSALYPETININGNNYTLNKVPETESSYTITIPGNDIAQKYNAKINSVILNSGNEVQLENQNLEYEVLKDHVKVSGFAFNISDSNADKVELSITIEDKDSANKRTKLEIIDEYGDKVSTSQENLEVGDNNISFTKTEAGKYTVSVYSSYDRDSDPTEETNYYGDKKIHSQIVSLTTRYIEMKDIVDIKLYTFDDLGNAVRVDSLTEDNLNVVENSLVEVSMKTIPTFYSKVASYKKEDGKLKLVLDYKDAMVYTGDDELKPLEVTLDILENTEEYEYKGSFKALIAKMKAHNNVGDVINLDKDYDLLDYPIADKQTAYIDFDYKGTINGNGHTISNLTKPLFKKLDGATVENLVIKGIVFAGTGEAKAPIATYATNSAKISNVHVDNFVSSGNGTAGLVYELSNNSVIEKSSATNITYNTTYLSQTISAGIVSMKSGSKIENCYVQGSMSSGWWNNAGFVVSAENTCEINNNIVNMKMAAYYGFNEAYGNGNGGIVGSDANNTNSAGLKLKNNLSLVEGNKGVGAIYNYKRCKLDPKESSNNYQLDTAVVKHEEDNSVKTISKEEIDADFFRNELGLDGEIWNISDDASIDNLPVLKGVSTAYTDGGKRPNNTEIYIPDYKRVSELDNYNEDREITYHNMYKLMPFYDAKEIIRDGNKIPDNHDLTKKIIKYIVPFNKDGVMVSHLTTENYNSLDKIYIVFEDGTRLTYNIAFDDYYGNVTSYMIPELNIGYNYNNYVVDPNQDSIRRLIEEASKYDFKKDLDPVTESVANDSRLYREHFENYTKDHIEDFVINLLVNMGYSPNFESDVLDDMIERELINTGELKKLLFAYNYFTYWYNLDMDGINLADATMFHSNEMFDKNMTMEYLTDQLVQGSNSATNGTAGFYNSYFVKYTKLSNLGYYLDYYVKTLTHYEKGIDWFKDHFKGGYYYDVNVDGADDLYYTLWDHLLKDGKVQTDFLPLMTVPENSMYVMSSPSQAYFGSLRVYMTDPNDPKQIEAFKAKVEKWLGEIQSFYTFAYNYWGPDNINKYCDTNYDMRYTYTGVGNITVYNNPLTTEEPYHKYFAEAIGRWPATHGGAYANGNEVFWAVIKMLDNFRVGTHETLHNQDSKIFLNGYGRRGGAEDYAAGFIQQYYRDGWVSPNIFDEEADLANPVFKDNVSQNLRKSSVEDDKKLHAYYDKYFRVNDFLDWIEAKAYFTLTSDQKANISVQVSYPEVGPDQQDAGDDVVAYTPLTPDMVKDMKLDSMEDLWKNKIMLRPGVKDYERRSPGADTDSIFNIHWYQPHADNDRPDGANFKYIAWQMAGEGGYYEGLVPYYTLSYIGIKKGTGEKTTDLTALRYIMKDENMTFERYKLERYEKLATHYNDEGTYIDAQQIYTEYLEALKTDANNNDRNLSKSTAVKKKYFQKIRRETEDFTIEPFEARAEAATISLDEEQINIENGVVTTSEELISKIAEDPNAIITLGNDIDLTEYVDGEAVIDTVFSGTLDGNNYTISGNRLPIFNTLDGATVENIRIKNAMISADSDEMGVLSKTITNSTITNVIVEDSTVYAANNVGGIAGLVDNSTFEDVHAKNIEITANNNIGGLVGYVKNNSLIQESSSNSKVSSNDDAVSTFVGRIESSEINNSYAVGSLVNKSTTENLNVGGFVGYADNAVLQNNFVKAEMDTPENVGGFIGEAVNTVNVNNNLSLSNLTNQGYKFDGRTDDKKLFSTDEHDIYMNNYELADTQGRATAQRNENISNVIVTIDSDMLTEEFFENELNFSTEIWDLSEVNNDGLPKLKNSDPNGELKLVEENENNVEEVLPHEEEEPQTDSEENVNEEILPQEQEEVQTENDEIIEDNSITVQDEVEEVPQVQDTEEDIVIQEDTVIPESEQEDEVIVVIPEIMGVS